MTKQEIKDFCWWHTHDTSHLHSYEHDAFRVTKDDQGYSIELTSGYVQKEFAKKQCEKLNFIIKSLANETI